MAGFRVSIQGRTFLRRVAQEPKSTGAADLNSITYRELASFLSVVQHLPNMHKAAQFDPPNTHKHAQTTAPKNHRLSQFITG
jgi:hypothetical protein